jgi:hypothetical protein
VGIGQGSYTPQTGSQDLRTTESTNGAAQLKPDRTRLLPRRTRAEHPCIHLTLPLTLPFQDVMCLCLPRGVDLTSRFDTVSACSNRRSIDAGVVVSDGIQQTVQSEHARTRLKVDPVPIQYSYMFRRSARPCPGSRFHLLHSYS